jgi:acetyltransferase-like isoleucine patch superfamily enzyme
MQIRVIHLLRLFAKIWKRIKMLALKKLFKSAGANIIFDPNDRFSYESITIGNDVFIGSGAKFSASESSINIGRKVMFGPNVTIMGGDHNTSVIGKYMFDVKEKQPGNDLPVLINDDVWVGCGVTILKGVTIGEGAIVAAGALVINSVEAYSIVGGVPAKKLSMRFSPEEIKKHKNILGISECAGYLE